MSTDVLQPPFVITADDKRGLIVVITATTLSFVWTCFLIRIYLRTKTREWRSDDYFLAAATILDTVQSALVLHLVGEGLGTSQQRLSDGDLEKIGRDEFGSQILYIITLFLSKCAVLFLYLRLSPGRGHSIASWIALSVSGVWALFAIILVAVPCNPFAFWTQGPERCTGVYPKWQAIGAIDIMTEVLIFAISIYLIAKLNMQFGSKIMVVSAFSARLPVIAASAIRLFYLNNTLTSPDRTLYGSYYVVATQWQIGYAIMSSTITGLGPFLRPFTKSSSTAYRRSSYSHQPSAPHSAVSTNHSVRNPGQSSYQMDDLNAHAVSVIHADGRSITNSSSGSDSAGARSSRAQIVPAARNHAHTSSSNSNEGLTLRPDEFQRDTLVSGGGGDAGDEEDAASRLSDESRRMMIRKKTVFSVETDRASAVRDERWRNTVELA